MNNIIKFLLTIFVASAIAYSANYANAAKYVFTYNSEIIKTYHGESFNHEFYLKEGEIFAFEVEPDLNAYTKLTKHLVLDSFNLDLAIFQNGEIVERAKTSEEIENEAKEIILQNIKKGEKVIAHVIYLNDLRSATDQVKLGFLALESVKQAKELLSIGRISMAKSVIESAEIDGTLITTELKTAIISYIEGL
jgi:hypothetical protein